MTSVTATPPTMVATKAAHDKISISENNDDNDCAMAMETQRENMSSDDCTPSPDQEETKDGKCEVTVP